MNFDRYFLAPKSASIPSSKNEPPPVVKRGTNVLKKAPAKPAPAVRRGTNVLKKASTKSTPVVKSGTNTLKKAAPRGVPSLVRWKRNGDSSITGFISGSPRFKEGEKVTTSPITNGNVKSGEVVKTGSGSSYYLV